jgi:hypothetical protein
VHARPRRVSLAASVVTTASRSPRSHAVGDTRPAFVGTNARPVASHGRRGSVDSYASALHAAFSDFSDSEDSDSAEEDVPVIAPQPTWLPTSTEPRQATLRPLANTLGAHAQKTLRFTGVNGDVIEVAADASEALFSVQA